MLVEPLHVLEDAVGDAMVGGEVFGVGGEVGVIRGNERGAEHFGGEEAAEAHRAGGADVDDVELLGVDPLKDI